MHTPRSFAVFGASQTHAAMSENAAHAGSGLGTQIPVCCPDVPAVVPAGQVQGGLPACGALTAQTLGGIGVQFGHVPLLFGGHVC